MPSKFTRIAWRLILGGVFLWAAAAKLSSGINPDVPQTIYDQFVRHSLAIHYFFIVSEFLLGLWMISGVFNRGAAAVTLAVLCVFTLILAWELRQMDPKACGCMRPVLPEDTEGAIRRNLVGGIIRNGMLMVAAAWLMLSKRSPAQQGGVPAPLLPAAAGPADSEAKEKPPAS